jgi:hypothetical protein
MQRLLRSHFSLYCLHVSLKLLRKKSNSTGFAVGPKNVIQSKIFDFPKNSKNKKLILWKFLRME